MRRAFAAESPRPRALAGSRYTNHQIANPPAPHAIADERGDHGSRLAGLPRDSVRRQHPGRRWRRWAGTASACDVLELRAGQREDPLAAERELRLVLVDLLHGTRQCNGCASGRPAGLQHAQPRIAPGDPCAARHRAAARVVTAVTIQRPDANSQMPTSDRDSSRCRNALRRPCCTCTCTCRYRRILRGGRVATAGSVMERACAVLRWLRRV